MNTTENALAICTHANWFNSGGALLVLVGFLVLWLSAERKHKETAKAEEARRAASLALEEANAVALRASDELVAVDMEIQKFAKLMGGRDLHVGQRNAALEKKQISQRAGYQVAALRADAAAKARRGDEAAILGLKVERSSLRTSTLLIVVGLAVQIVGHYPGC